ncbi:MAG: hypothetical protein JO352_01530 [Chloroflexi bacterium]|nr:hypothetical protein [Chloroflexota bacterium]MBV9600679.1 hypothetical protein [Chloroflexota bacterium]
MGGTGLWAGVGVGMLLACVFAIAYDLFRPRAAGDETPVGLLGTPEAWRWGLITAGLMVVGGVAGYLLKH